MRAITLAAAAAALLLTSVAPPAAARGPRPPRRWKVVKGHENFVTELAVSAKGDLLASLSQDGTARTFRLPKGKAIARVDEPDDATFGAMALSPDGKRWAIAAGARVAIYDPKRGQKAPPKRFDPGVGNVTTLAFDASSSTLVAGGEKGARLYSLVTEKPLAFLAKGEAVAVARFAPPKGAVALALGKGIALYDRLSGKRQRLIAAKEVSAFAFDRTGGRVALRAGTALEVRKTKDGALLFRKEGMAADADVAFGPHDKVVIGGFEPDAASRNKEQLKAFDATSGRLRWFVTGGSAIGIFTIGRGLLVSGANEGRIWLWRYR